MKFIKMHGAGNDYIYVDCFQETAPVNLPETARRISDRHFGVGGDGLILIRPSDIADARMQMFNADGSEAEMCGNGIRCVAKYVYEAGIARKPVLRIETGNGVLELELEVSDDRVGRVRVDLGEPILEADRIPTALSGDPVVDQPLEIDGQTVNVTCVSMGNPHCVIFVKTATDDMVSGLGPKLEHGRQFPNRINVEFVETLSRTEVRQRT